MEIEENITPKKIREEDDINLTQTSVTPNGGNSQQYIVNEHIYCGDLLPLNESNNKTPIKIQIRMDGSEPLLFGRLKTCHFVFTEVIVSGQHCRIIKKSESLLIEDLSTNGTYLNGKLIGKGKFQILKNKDLLGFGRVSKDVDLTYLFNASKQYLLLNPSQTQSYYWESKGIKKEVLQEYDFIKELGSGNFSVVYEGVQKSTGQRVAIKFVNLSKYQQSEGAKLQVQLNREIEILKKTNHPNIISIKDIFYSKDDQHLFFILELADGGELYDRIGYDSPMLNEQEAKYIFKQLLNGVSYLHYMGIAHRDLKPENILFVNNYDLSIKISDFGLARFINEGELAKTLCGSPLYVAPEVIVSKTKHQIQNKELLSPNGYGMTCDAWSLGAILYIILSGSPPFHDDQDDLISTPQLFEQIVSGDIQFPLEIWSNISSVATDLVKKLLTVDPSQRLTVEQAINHPWILNSDDNNNNNNNLKNIKKRVLVDETNILLNQLALQSSNDFNQNPEIKKRKSFSQVAINNNNNNNNEN
ncbi:putative protein serine/threonine kinase [Tieghemostelium lacteum]|uniref:non-specific serine/threonine protein kinase n=1 Tax=Tieghemostelium lacteum TaxID=361077 RepID=A0A151Z5X9_TIELA|nr:putative protein serine/threonine kinase [Tieghemostelium lacteum]|eukprot:KYQ89204.1 putative protein serine/threonine kinase [Tieghemostelium lacteum]